MHSLRFFRTALLLAAIGAAASLWIESTHGQTPSLATPESAFRVPKGFKVELLYEVPAQDQGSWVNLCVDPQGRLITSDQYGKLYRVTMSGSAVDVVPLNIDLGMAQGLLYAYDSLYVDINGKGPSGPGLYRIKDTDGDDQYDEVKHLVPMVGGGEHGPHAVIPGPDGKIYFCAGNATDLPAKIDGSLVPKHWSEDHLLGRLPDGRGFMKDRLAPGGFVARMNPDGSDIELVATGFRNEYDIAFNPQGDLFAFDADMEWDLGTPWYRPTRVNHVISGAEFGWRNGTGKWPEYYPDSFGAVVNVGPGSPTGIAFGTGAKFPEKYQRALFIGDWSYGIVYAVHMDADGASYNGTAETFMTAAPMPITDMVIHPQDGAMYFAIGGRKVQSGLYRLSYVGEESTAPAEPVQESAEILAAREQRRTLESYHGRRDAAVIPAALEGLGSPDRSIRFAARIALEHQDFQLWREKVLSLTAPSAVINGAVALARCGQKSDQEDILNSLNKLNWDDLNRTERLELMRAYGLAFTRLGEANESAKKQLTSQFDSHFPSGDGIIDRELAVVLVYAEAPKIASLLVSQLKQASAQEDQIHYAFCGRQLKTGWTKTDREGYFQWFFDAASQRGGASFGGFLDSIRQAAIANLSDSDRTTLGDLLTKKPEPKDPVADLTPRPLVKQWTVDELASAAEKKQAGHNFDRGREMFAIAQCYKCHRFTGQGGIQGPDLTAAGGRFSIRDILTAIIEPNKEISDQYQAMQFLTEDDNIIVGRIANLKENTYQVVTNMLDPGSMASVQRDKIVEMRPSPVSMMPAGLVDTLTEEEILDLVAYIRSGGRSDNAAFEKTGQ